MSVHLIFKMHFLIFLLIFTEQTPPRRGAEKRARDFVVLGPADRAALPRAAHLAKRAQLPLKDRFSKTSSGLILRNFSMSLMDVGIFASIELLRNSDQNS